MQPESNIPSGTFPAASHVRALSGRAGVLDPIPADSPALVEAMQISKATVELGFEWETLGEVWEKVHEEEAELKQAYQAAPLLPDGRVDVQASPAAAHEVELELGDMLFSLVNVARKMGLDAESALHATTTKFRSRWAAMEQAAQRQGMDLAQLSTPQLEQLWQQAKALERSRGK